MPEYAARVKRYRDDAPLFSRFQIEHQIESAYARTVQLPSGGAIVIDHTEALVSVDVNSARAIKGGDIEETATRTNLEAADEVARQMRLRDLGGLIVIDFIDMEESKNRREVENRLRDALRQDRARVQFGSISKFGLLEMSRQRLKPALSEGASIPCPRCGGAGHIRDTESSALQILRIIQEESMKDNTAAVHAQVPVEVASFLLNEKRPEIAKIELKQRLNVLLVPNRSLETPHYKVERLKHDDPRLDRIEASYKMAEEVEDPTTVTRRSQEPTNKQTPVIKGVLPDAPAPAVAPKTEVTPAAKAAKPAAAAPATGGGFFAWLKNLFTGASQEAKPAAQTAKKEEKSREGSGGDRNRRGGRRGEGRGERTERADGQERNNRRNAAGAEGESRAERAPRSERSDRPQRERRNEPRQDTTNLAAPTESGSEGETRTERAPRRERGERGEGRRERGERRNDRHAEATAEARNESMDTVSAESPNTAESAEVQAPAQSERRERRGRDRYGRERRERQTEGRNESTDTVSQEAPLQTAEGSEGAPRSSYFDAFAAPAAAPVHVAADTPAAVASAEAAAPVKAAAQSESRALPKVASYTLPTEELLAVASQSGLQWVNSDADKVAAVQAAIAAEPKPIHVPRERAPVVVLDEGPLVLVETRKDLSEMKLPF